MKKKPQKQQINSLISLYGDSKKINKALDSKKKVSIQAAQKEIEFFAKP